MPRFHPSFPYPLGVEFASPGPQMLSPRPAPPSLPFPGHVPGLGGEGGGLVMNNPHHWGLKRALLRGGVIPSSRPLLPPSSSPATLRGWAVVGRRERRLGCGLCHY